MTTCALNDIANTSAQSSMRNFSNTADQRKQCPPMGSGVGDIDHRISGYDEFAGDREDYLDMPLVNQPGSRWEYGVSSAYIAWLKLGTNA